MVSLSLGGGAFDAPQRYEVPTQGFYGDVADLTGDGIDDVVVCSDGGLAVLINDGAGGLDDSLFLARDLGSTCRPTPVDLDGDGRVELLVSAPPASGWYLLRTCAP